MGLTEIPARTDGSIGREKTDVRPAVDLGREVPAAEYNRLADALIDVSEAVGLRDGSTPDSIEARLTVAGGVAFSFTMEGDTGAGFFPTSSYVRGGEDPDVVANAQVYLQGGVSGADLYQMTFPAQLPTDEYQVHITPESSAGPAALMGLADRTEYNIDFFLQAGADPSAFHVSIIYGAA